MTRTLIRGDSYEANDPAYHYVLTDTETEGPLNLTACTVRTTFKRYADTDADDSTAAIIGTIVFDGNGDATSAIRLVLPAGKSAADGELDLHLTSADTSALPLGVSWINDMEITDADGRKKTVLFTEKTRARDGLTNRTTG